MKSVISLSEPMCSLILQMSRGAREMNRVCSLSKPTLFEQTLPAIEIVQGDEKELFVTNL